MSLIAISPGDPAGIGPEVCLRALKPKYITEAKPAKPNMHRETPKLTKIIDIVEMY